MLYQLLFFIYFSKSNSEDQNLELWDFVDMQKIYEIVDFEKNKNSIDTFLRKKCLDENCNDISDLSDQKNYCEGILEKSDEDEEKSEDLLEEAISEYLTIIDLLNLKELDSEELLDILKNNKKLNDSIESVLDTLDKNSKDIYETIIKKFINGYIGADYEKNEEREDDKKIKDFKNKIDKNIGTPKIQFKLTFSSDKEFLDKLENEKQKVICRIFKIFSHLKADVDLESDQNIFDFLGKSLQKEIDEKK